jgi:cell division transport system permease protein
MRAWLWHHLESLSASFARFAGAPVAALINVAVMGVALALPAGLYVVLVNVQSFARALAPEPQLSLFLALDAGTEGAGRIEARLKHHRGVRAYRYVPRDRALAELKARAGLADVVDSLPRNPLPDAFIVEPSDTAPPALEALRTEFGRWPGVAHVQLDSEWARRLASGLRVGRLAVALLSGLFAFALVAVTFNTIRLQILTRREEIEVARLIGATASFIRRPFLYFGALQGLAGGVAAWLLVWLALRVLNGGLVEVGELYGARIELSHMDARDTATLFAIAAGLGWMGSWLSVSRHLGRIDAS